MGRCITIITLSGATSLGLLTGSLAYQSRKAIPDLISQLKNQASLTTDSAKGVLKKIKSNLTIANVFNTVLAAASTWAFSTVYRYSPASGKHPFLIYSAIGAPLAVAAFWLQTGIKACGIAGPFSGVAGVEKLFKASLAKLSKKPSTSKENESNETSEVTTSETSLDQSYIQVSEESDSSPETPADVSETVSSSIEDEVDAALKKKERVADLEVIASAYNVSAAIAGVAFVISSIGIVGDQLFL